MTTLVERLAGLRHRLGLIIAVALCAGVAAVVVSVLTPTTWTARAVLTTSSDRTPEQDAYLAVGYAAFFNSDSYQGRVAARLTGVGRVTFAARTAANSPIVYVEATSADPAAASAAAGTLATALRDDVNGGLQTDTTERVQLLQDQVTPLRDRLNLPLSDAERASVQQSINSLQNQIATIRADTTNQLKILQADGGVAANSRHPVTDAAFGLAGGLLAGILLALALDAVRPRLRDRAAVRAHLGLDTLAVLDGGARDDVELADMAGMIALRDVPDPLTLCVTGPARGPRSSDVAGRIARAWSEQNGPVVLVRSPAARPSTSFGVPGRPDLRDLLADRTRPAPLVPPGEHVAVVGAGRDHLPGTLTRPRVTELLGRLGTGRSAVLVDAPAVADTVADRVLCASAARTVVVIGSGSRASDAAATIEILTRIGADVLGAVLVRGDRPEPSAEAVRPESGAPVPPRPRPRPGPDTRVPAGLDVRD